MAIYHCAISNVSRAGGSSACASLSYITAESVYEERTAQTYSYGRSERVLTSGTLLPDGAPEAWRDPAQLFNAIENHEKAENARTAKKIEVALPREFTLEISQRVIERYITENLTKAGYAATYAIHTDPDNNNPHAHILVPNRQISPDTGTWATAKTRKEYALDEKGNRIPLIDTVTGEQKLGKRNEKLWKRITVEQNPLDKKDFLLKLRESWAVECNRELEPEQGIDHRSNEERGFERIPTIHVGYAGREMEKRGEVSDRAEINREIQQQNLELLALQQILDDLQKDISEDLPGPEIDADQAVVVLVSSFGRTGAEYYVQDGEGQLWYSLSFNRDMQQLKDQGIFEGATVRLSEGRYSPVGEEDRKYVESVLNGPQEPQEGLERHEGIQGYIEYHRAEQADLGPQRPRRGQREER